MNDRKLSNIKDDVDYSTFLINYGLFLDSKNNSIIRRRGSSLLSQDSLTIDNPELILTKNEDFIPKAKIPCILTRHYYLAKAITEKLRLFFYMKVSTYKKTNYKRTKLNIQFEVINKIGIISESRVKDELHTKSFDSSSLIKSTPQNDTHIFGNNFLYPIVFSTDKRIKTKNVHYSDIRWQDRSKYYQSTVLPYDLVLWKLHSDISSIREKEYSKKQNTKNTKSAKSNNLIVDGIEINDLIYEYYAPNLWIKKEDDLVKQFIDTRLIKFLVSKEIPLWASITANSLKRPIKYEELEFLNNSNLSLIILSCEHLNPIIHYSLEFLDGFIHTLLSAHKIALCKRCNRFMKYRTGKKYCSKVSEKRGCGRRSRNKRHYNKYREKILKYSREEMRKTRDLLTKLESS